jgi:hypothetical protein
MTFTANAAQARSERPTVSGTPQIYVTEYEGGDKNSAGKDLEKTGETLGKAMILLGKQGNHIVTNDDRWKVSQVTESRGQVKKDTLLETGGIVSSATGRDVGANLGNPIIDEVWKAEKLALAEAKGKRAKGETVNFYDPATQGVDIRADRAYNSIKKYEHSENYVP